MSNNLQVQFRDCNNQVLGNRKFLFNPTTFPEVTASFLTVKDSYQFTSSNSGTISSSVVASLYEVTLANPKPETEFYLLFNEQSSSLYSGSVQSGSTQYVFFNMIDLVKDYFDVRKITITPTNSYPEMFSGSIICLNSTSSLTDATGSTYFQSLIPGVYQVDAYGKVVTTFHISVPVNAYTGSTAPRWNAKDLRVVKPAKATKVKLTDADNSYVLTVSASDARYAMAGASNNSASSSWASASLVSVSSSFASASISASFAYHAYNAEGNRSVLSPNGVTPPLSFSEDSGLNSNFTAGTTPLYKVYSYINVGETKVFVSFGIEDSWTVSTNYYSIIVSWLQDNTADGYRIFRDRDGNGYDEYHDVAGRTSVSISDRDNHPASTWFWIAGSEASDAIPTTFDLNSYLNHSEGAGTYGIFTNGSGYFAENIKVDGSVYASVVTASLFFGTASVAISSSISNKALTATSSSWASQSIWATTSSYASVSFHATSASFASRSLAANSSSFASASISSSYALSASWAPGGGSQTPWTSNIDGGNYDLANVSHVTIDNGNANATLKVYGYGDGGNASIGQVEWYGSSSLNKMGSLSEDGSGTYGLFTLNGGASGTIIGEFDAIDREYANADKRVGIFRMDWDGAMYVWRYYVRQDAVTFTECITLGAGGVTSSAFIGDGSQLTNLDAAEIVGVVNSANSSSFASSSLTARSASWASQSIWATTSSYASNSVWAVSSSYASVSFWATSASFASASISASYVTGTGSMPIFIGSAKLPATSSARIDNGENGFRLLYDAGSPQSASWQFLVPSDYIQSASLRIGYAMTGLQSGTNNVIWRVNMYCPASTNDFSASSNQSFIYTSSLTNNKVAGLPTYAEIPLASVNVSMSADSYCWMNLERMASATSDTATTDAEVMAMSFKYIK